MYISPNRANFFGKKILPTKFGPYRHKKSSIATPDMYFLKLYHVIKIKQWKFENEIDKVHSEQIINV